MVRSASSSISKWPFKLSCDDIKETEIYAQKSVNAATRIWSTGWVFTGESGELWLSDSNKLQGCCCVPVTNTTHRSCGFQKTTLMYLYILTTKQKVVSCSWIDSASLFKTVEAKNG